MKPIVILLVMGILAIGLRASIPRLGKSVAGGIVERNGQPALAACPDTPNCHSAEFVISAEPADAISTLADVVTQQKGAKIVTQDPRYLHATFTSNLMGFVDDVEFLLVVGDTNGQQRPPRLLVRSASRLGKSDLGANKKRVERLRSASIQRL